MYIKSSYTPTEEKILDKFEIAILKDKSLTDREKVQCWVWVHASLFEKRFSEDELKVLLQHIQKNPHFFKDLIMNLIEIHHLIKTENQNELIRRLKESIEMIDALKKIG